MKRLLIVLPLLALSACSPDDNAQAQKEAADAFNQAMAHVANATAGYPAGQGAPADGEYEAYRIAQYKAAADILSKITNKGSNTQKATASMALSDVLSELAADASARATAAWAEHNRRCDTALTTLAKAQNAGGLTGALGGIDLTDDSNRFAALRQAAAQRLNGLRGDKSRIESKLRDLSRKKRDLDTRRKGLTIQSNDIRNRSYEAKGELRFELHKKSAGLSLRADKLGAEAERVSQDIAQTQGELRQVERQMQLVDRQRAGIERAMGSISSSSQSYQHQATASAGEAETLAKQLVDELSKLNDDYKNQVHATYAEATGYTQRALKASQGAARAARGNTRRVAREALARRAISNALLCQEAAGADGGFAQMVELISRQADAALPEQPAATIREMHAAIAEQAKASNDTAVEAYKQAADPIGDAAENAKDENKTEALNRKIQLYATLLDLSGELAYREQLAEARGQLREWQDELAQREAEEAAIEAESQEQETTEE